MGLEIDRVDFDDDERARFSTKLDACIEALTRLLERPGFGEGAPTIGAECEVDLVDAHGRPVEKNLDVLARARDARVVCEVDRFNVEVNTRPTPLAGRPFASLRAELDDVLGVVERAAAELSARVIAVGILPTLEERDLSSSAITEKKRYRALANALAKQRKEPFVIDIRGDDDVLSLATDDVAYEGANTSFQVHLKIPPARFADAYNAAQLAVAPALAVAANAPLFLGRRLWDETRIALFRQSVDERGHMHDDEWRPARVTFGHGFVRHGALELFRESVVLHAPLLPIVTDESPLDVVAAGSVPALAELKLHQGTVWRWNRAVYDDQDGGHVRIEMRALPSGPTSVDMAANAAFMLGATLALERDIEAWLAGIPFSLARRNFYEAARRGLDATLLFPDVAGGRAREVAVRELVLRLVEPAFDALVAHGVEQSDARAALDIVVARVERDVTGARWQRAEYAALRARLSHEEASAALVEAYLANARSGAPVHTW